MAKPAIHRPTRSPHGYQLTRVPFFDPLIQIKKQMALKTAVLGSRRSLGRVFFNHALAF